MRSLPYNADIPYNSPEYSYNGFPVVVRVITIKDALYRELRYGATLAGLVAGENIHVDGRLTADGEYPWLLLRRITSSEDNRLCYARERWEMEIVVSDATDNDALLESIENAIKNAFAGKKTTWGQYTSAGAQDLTTGLSLQCEHVNTVEGYDEGMHERAKIMIFLFRYLRT